MSKYFLISRIVILVALLFVLLAMIWGWTHQKEATASAGYNHQEKYHISKPGAGTTLFFLISVIFGLFLVSFSIWLEWMRTRSSRQKRESGDAGIGETPDRGREATPAFSRRAGWPMASAEREAESVVPHPRVFPEYPGRAPAVDLPPGDDQKEDFNSGIPS